MVVVAVVPAAREAVMMMMIMPVIYVYTISLCYEEITCLCSVDSLPM